MIATPINTLHAVGDMVHTPYATNCKILRRQVMEYENGVKEVKYEILGVTVTGKTIRHMVGEGEVLPAAAPTVDAYNFLTLQRETPIIKKMYLRAMKDGRKPICAWGDIIEQEREIERLRKELSKQGWID